jgi:hypothetical protein
MVDSPLTPPAGIPQYSPAFTYSDAFVAYHEAGKTRNDGIGHIGAFGIDQNANPKIDVLNLTPRQAQAIRYKYWQAINGDKLAQIDPRAALIAYDTAIASGTGTAFQMLKNHGVDAEKMYRARVNFIEGLIARNPQKFGGNVATSWRRVNDNLGKTTGLIPGKPEMPPLETLAKGGVYVPPGYSADENTSIEQARYNVARQREAARRGTPVAPETAGQPAPPSPFAAQAKTGAAVQPSATPPAGAEPQSTPNPFAPTPGAPEEKKPEAGVFEEVADALQKGAAGATGAKTQQTAALPAVTKPNVDIPTGRVAPNQRELYAKALESISQRNASAQAAQSKPTEFSTPATKPAPEAETVKVEEPQNEPQA